MRLSRISRSFTGSLSYALLNRAGGTSGAVFQIYSLVWIMWLAFFLVAVVYRQSYSPVLQPLASSLMSSWSALPADGTAVSLPVFVLSLTLFVLVPYVPVHVFWVYEDRVGISRRRLRGAQVCEAAIVECNLSGSLELGFPCTVNFRVSNPSDIDMGNVWLRWVFPGALRCDSPQVRLGTVRAGSSGYVSIPFVPLYTGKTSLGSADLYFEIRRQQYTKYNISQGTCTVICSSIYVNTSVPEVLKFGEEAVLGIYLANRLSCSLEDVQVKCCLKDGIDPGLIILSAGTLHQGSGQVLNLSIVPKIIGEFSPGHFEVHFRLGANACIAGPEELGVQHVLAPELYVRMNTPDTLYKGIPASLGFIVENRSEEPLSNISLSSCFSSQVECEVPTICIEGLLPSSSRYASLAIRPLTSGKTDLGNLNVSFEVNGIMCRMEPIVLGVHKIN